MIKNASKDLNRAARIVQNWIADQLREESKDCIYIDDEAVLVKNIEEAFLIIRADERQRVRAEVLEKLRSVASGQFLDGRTVAANWLESEWAKGGK